MAIVFDHAAIYGGKYYPPNTPIEETAQTATAGAENGEKPEAPTTGREKAKAPQKAVKSRKKGDA